MNFAPLCNQFDDYYDQWLDADERDRFEQHLSACPHCQQQLHLQRTLDRELAAAFHGQACDSDSLVPAERVRASNRSSWQQVVERGAIALAAAILVIVVVFSRPNFRQTAEQQPRTSASDQSAESRAPGDSRPLNNAERAQQSVSADSSRSLSESELPIIWVRTSSDDFIAVVEEESEAVTVVQLFSIDRPAPTSP